MINILGKFLKASWLSLILLKFFILKLQNNNNRETESTSLLASFCLIGIIMFYSTKEAEVKNVFENRENIFKFRLEVSETF